MARYTPANGECPRRAGRRPPGKRVFFERCLAMAVTRESMLAWCQTLLGVHERPCQTLAEYLAAIPRLATLAYLPAGRPVLLRGDVDAKPGAKIGEGDIRLRSMVDTLKFGRDHGWKQII